MNLVTVWTSYVAIAFTCCVSVSNTCVVPRGYASLVKSEFIVHFEPTVLHARVVVVAVAASPRYFRIASLSLQSWSCEHWVMVVVMLMPSPRISTVQTPPQSVSLVHARMSVVQKDVASSWRAQSSMSWQKSTPFQSSHPCTYISRSQ